MQVKRLQRLNMDVEKHERELSQSLESMLGQLRVSNRRVVDADSKVFTIETGISRRLEEFENLVSH